MNVPFIINVTSCHLIWMLLGVREIDHKQTSSILSYCYNSPKMETSASTPQLLFAGGFCVI